MVNRRQGGGGRWGRAPTPDPSTATISCRQVVAVGSGVNVRSSERSPHVEPNESENQPISGFSFIDRFSVRAKRLRRFEGFLEGNLAT